MKSYLSLPNTINSLYFCGDLHWNPNYLKWMIKKYDLNNSCIICCGDFGIGFSPKMEQQELALLNKFCNLRSIYVLALQGNHDCKIYFIDSKFDDNKYVYLIPSYTIINVLGKNILNIGGAISIDRKYRQRNDSVNIVKYMKYHNCDYKTAELKAPRTYWEDEAIVYQSKVKEHIDIICSHSAPSFCYPIDKGFIVQEFAQYDDKLLEDVANERTILDKVYEDYKDTVTHWYYGHFHNSYSQVVGNTYFKLLNINELFRHYESSSNNNIL